MLSQFVFDDAKSSPPWDRSIALRIEKRSTFLSNWTRVKDPRWLCRRFSRYLIGTPWITSSNSRIFCLRGNAQNTHTHTFFYSLLGTLTLLTWLVSNAANAPRIRAGGPGRCWKKSRLHLHKRRHKPLDRNPDIKLKQDRSTGQHIRWIRNVRMYAMYIVPAPSSKKMLLLFTAELRY